MRRLARGVLERLAVGIGLHQLAGRRGARSLVLAYHNVVPDDATVRGDQSLHLCFARFRDQLDMLGETYRVVSLRDLVLEGPCVAPDPLVAITFDDAYRGALALAIPELVRRGLPATVFVAPGTLGGGAFWWDMIADERTGVVDPSIREFALRELRGESSAIREWVRRDGRGVNESDAESWERPGTEEELREATRDSLITVGSHAWSHVNLTRVSADRLHEELSRPIEWLEDRLRDRAVRYLAYPYGLSSPSVAAAARDATYEAAFLVTGGALPRATWPTYTLPRINIPSGVSARGFRLLLSGALRR